MKRGVGIMSLKIAFLFGVLFWLSSWISCGEASVSYDHKAISINGQRKILISGSIHYPRSTPEVCFELNVLFCFEIPLPPLSLFHTHTQFQIVFTPFFMGCVDVAGSY